MVSPERLEDWRGIAREILDDAKTFRSEHVKSNLLVRRHLAKELDSFVSREDRVGKTRLRAVEQNYSSICVDAAFSRHTVRKRIRRQRLRQGVVGGPAVNGEEADLLLLAVVENGEVTALQVADECTFLVARRR